MDDPAQPRLSGLLAGGIEGIVAVHDALAADLHGYAWFLLDPGRHDADDSPAAAVLDALLVAGETVGKLADPALARAWLYALTRNECLRHHPVDWPAADAEAGVLARHGLAPDEVAAVLGHAVPVPAVPEPAVPEPAVPEPGEPAPPLPAPPPPGWLRAELVAALGVDGAGRRVELARRAHPYDPEGFPVPADSHRLSGRTLAWSAAAAVLVALALLVSLPAGGAIRALPGPAQAAAVPARVDGATVVAPLPTLPPTAFGTQTASSGPRPGPAPDRGAHRRSASTTPAGVPPATKLGDQRRLRTALQVTWHAGSDCDDTWTADLRARPYGGDQAAIAAVTASVTAGGRARTVSLTRDGASWRGELAGLPTDRQLTVTVRAAAADGSTVRSVSRELADSC